jgi:hypothetical protein
MRMSRVRRVLGLVPIFALGLTGGGAAASRAPVKGPRAILLYGGPLDKPVVVQPRAATAAFLAALIPDTSPAAPNEIPTGPAGAGTSGAISVAIFWAPRPFGLPDDTLPVAGFRWPEVADQRGRLYPASRTAPALLVLDASSGFPAARRRVTVTAARLLAERGVPPRLVSP